MELNFQPRPVSEDLRRWIWPNRTWELAFDSSLALYGCRSTFASETITKKNYKKILPEFRRLGSALPFIGCPWDSDNFQQLGHPTQITILEDFHRYWHHWFHWNSWSFALLLQLWVVVNSSQKYDDWNNNVSRNNCGHEDKRPDASARDKIGSW